MRFGIKDLKRNERYIIPIEVIRELVANSIVHRDYSINSNINFTIFDDRIEMLSPGGLPGNLDIQSIIDGRSEIRNKVIARFFKEIGYIEQWGTGIRRIISFCNKNNIPFPTFIDDGRYFKVIVYYPNDQEESNVFENMPDTAGNMPDLINIFNKNGFITRKDVEKIFNVKDRRARDILKSLIDKNVLQRYGKGPKTKYKFIIK